MRGKPKAPEIDSPAWSLTQHISNFVNAAFGRRLRPSKAVYDEIVSAFDHGYTEDDMRVAFWAACCLKNEWIGEALRNGGLTADIVLRHRGGINNQTGKPAVKWLDKLASRALEMNPAVVQAVFKLLPEEMKAGEKELLSRIGFEVM